MCGILGLVARPGQRPNATPQQMATMRDLMLNRGPDDAGLIAHQNVMMAHRLLAVIDPGHGNQPWWSPDKRFLLVYNGELYNDAELRHTLQSEHGVSFTSHCDTETLLHAFATWGIDCLNRLRGMFAFGIYDFVKNELTLARDPLGIKPLYFGFVEQSLIFGSHLPSILAHPKADASPNYEAVSAYLSTIRTTTGNATLFAGLSVLRPGQFATLQFDNQHQPKIDGAEYWQPEVDTQHHITLEEAAHDVRDAIVDSIGQHLRSDVSRCILLSGGLDSAIIATVAKELGATDALQTWCAGDQEDIGGDREFAQLMSNHLGTDHHDVVIDETMFDHNWLHLIQETGLPLSTPNETAIYAVAQSLKTQATVALSGEGADEMFGGYALPFLSGLDQLRSSTHRDTWPGDTTEHDRYALELQEQYGVAELGSTVDHFLRCNTWIHPADKPNLMSRRMIELSRADTLLRSEIQEQFDLAASQYEPTEQILQVQRRINLTGLLGRLDTTMMAAQVEGRTPFADVRIAELAMQLPLDCKVTIDEPARGGWSSAAVAVAEDRVTTKAVLRRAFADSIPPIVLQRPKASFPLPFQSWMGAAMRDVETSAFISEIIQPNVRKIIVENPQEHWQLAWPLANLARWAKHWWE